MNQSVTEKLHKEWAEVADWERQRKRIQQERQDEEAQTAKTATSNRGVRAVRRDDERLGEFEVVTDHTGALGAIWIRVVKGCEPAYLLREIKLALRYSNIEQMWGQVVKLCDKHSSRQFIQVVAGQDSITAALQGQQEITLRLHRPDGLRGTKFTVTRWDNVRILAEAGKSLSVQSTSHSSDAGWDNRRKESRREHEHDHDQGHDPVGQRRRDRQR